MSGVQVNISVLYLVSFKTVMILGFCSKIIDDVPILFELLFWQFNIIYVDFEYYLNLIIDVGCISIDILLV